MARSLVRSLLLVAVVVAAATLMVVGSARGMETEENEVVAADEANGRDLARAPPPRRTKFPTLAPTKKRRRTNSPTWAPTAAPTPAPVEYEYEYEYEYEQCAQVGDDCVSADSNEDGLQCCDGSLCSSKLSKCQDPAACLAICARRTKTTCARAVPQTQAPGCACLFNSRKGCINA